MARRRKEARGIAAYQCQESGELVRRETLRGDQGFPSTEGKDLGTWLAASQSNPAMNLLILLCL